MKTRKAWLLDDGVLLAGHKDKYGFHPQKDLGCGFDLQKISKRDIGRTAFYSLKKATKKLNNVELAGGQLQIIIDNGTHITKYIISDGTGDNIVGSSATNSFVGIADKTNRILFLSGIVGYSNNTKINVININ